MSFKAAVVECVLGHNKDKKYQRREPYNKKVVLILELKQNGVTWENITAYIQTGNSLKRHMVHEVQTIRIL